MLKKTVKVNKDIKYKFNSTELIKVLILFPSKYYNDYKHWIAITACLKSANLKDIWSDFSKKSNSYDIDNNNSIWDLLEPNTDLTYISILILQENIKSK